jgi:hypothetical protein
MGMHRTSILMVTIAVALATAACGNDETDSPRASQAPTTTAEGSATSTTTMPGETEVAIGEIRMTVTGGVAGVQQTVVVMPDGTVMAGEGGAEPEAIGRSLEAAELTALREDVGSEDFAALDDTYVPDGLCCDQRHFTVSAQVGDTTITSATADGIEAPPVLDDVVAQLEIALRDQ